VNPPPRPSIHQYCLLLSHSSIHPNSSFVSGSPRQGAGRCRPQEKQARAGKATAFLLATHRCCSWEGSSKAFLPRMAVSNPMIFRPLRHSRKEKREKKQKRKKKPLQAASVSTIRKSGRLLMLSTLYPTRQAWQFSKCRNSTRNIPRSTRKSRQSRSNSTARRGRPSGSFRHPASSAEAPAWEVAAGTASGAGRPGGSSRRPAADSLLEGGRRKVEGVEGIHRLGCSSLG